MKLVLVCSMAVLSVVCAGGAAAQASNNNITGSFGFTTTGVCLVAPGHVGDPTVPPPVSNPTPGVALPNSGFNANLQPSDISSGTTVSFSTSFETRGIRTFNGDGTGTVSGRVVGTTVRPTPGPNGFPHFPPSAGSSNFTFSFTYTVDGNGGWTSTMVPGSYTQTFLTGPRTGQTGTIDALPPTAGTISLDGRMLISAEDTPAVEVHTYSNGDVDPQICHRSTVFIAIGTLPPGGVGPGGTGRFSSPATGR